MERKENLADASTSRPSDDIESLQRRNFILRIAKAGAVIPVATVIYNASVTVASAY